MIFAHCSVKTKLFTSSHWNQANSPSTAVCLLPYNCSSVKYAVDLWNFLAWIFVIFFRFFCRVMLCRYSVFVRLSVCLSVRPSVKFVHSVKRVGLIVSSKFVHCRVAKSSFFHTKRHGNNGGVECRWDRQKSRSQPISGSIPCCERLDRQVQYTQLRRTMASWWH